MTYDTWKTTNPDDRWLGPDPEEEPMRREMELPDICAACDCVSDPEDMYYSLGGAGPFCDECWQSLSDPDQALLIEKRLEEAEARIEELEGELKRLRK